MTLSRTASLFGFLCVVLGAFGAHGLEHHLDAKHIGWCETGTFYALTHSIAAFAMGRTPRSLGYHRAGWVMLFGVTVFSGTLYAMALGAPPWLGAVTPLGGLGLLIGWGFAFFASKARER